MKIKCNREKLARLFVLASMAVAVKDVRPILQNVKMVAASNEVILTATDCETGIRISITEDITIDEPGEAILPTRLFKGIFQESRDNELTLEFNKDKTLVYGDRSLYELQTQSVTDFPDIIPFDDSSCYKIDGKVLRTLIRRTSFSTETENAQYALGGILLEFEPNQLSAVSTDGRRLSYQIGNAEKIGEEAPPDLTICPPKLFAMIDKALDDSKSVFIKVDQSKICVKSENIQIQSQLVNGRFPRWRSIIPKTEDKHCVEIIAGPLLAAARQASIVATEKDSSITLKFSTGKLELFSLGLEVGESHIDLPISYDSDPVAIKLDPKFLIQFLSIFNPEDLLSFYFKEKSAVLFRTNDGYTHLIMPQS